MPFTVFYSWENNTKTQFWQLSVMCKTEKEVIEHTEQMSKSASILKQCWRHAVQKNEPSTSFSMSFSTISTVLTLTRPVSSSVYSSVLVVIVSPTTLSDSRTLVGPGECRTASLGKSSLEGLKHWPITLNQVSFHHTIKIYSQQTTFLKITINLSINNALFI